MEVVESVFGILYSHGHMLKQEVASAHVPQSYSEHHVHAL